MAVLDDFDLNALYDALDAKRRSRGLTWQQVAKEIGAASGLSASTMSGMRTRAAIEGDGVLQMLRWLHRTPESFIPGLDGAIADAATLPAVGDRQILRFDTRKLHAALDAQRLVRALNWKQVAVEIGGVSAAGLTRLSKGGRTAFPQVMRMSKWLGRPAASFIRASTS